MNVVMIGAGYVGLVSGACFAEFGAERDLRGQGCGQDQRPAAGQIPIYEPGLESLVERNTRSGRLTFTTELATRWQQPT